MNNIIRYIDHTNLSPIATEKDILAFAEMAQDYPVASICVAPCYVDTLIKHFPSGIPVCTVIGFPNGYESSYIKAQSVAYAFEHGAKEVDYVISLGAVKEEKFGIIYHDIKQALYHKPQHGIFKVILETGALSKYEIIQTIKILNTLPIDFYKTSTGFGFSGASIEAAEIIMKYKHSDIQLKVSGGISDLESAQRFIDIGATRIGSSRLLHKCIEYKES